MIDIFKNIIGYDEVKIALKRIIDILDNPDKYKRLGAQHPKGLLLYGPPGTGKSSIATELINNVNRKSYIIRKSKSNGDFIKYLNRIFNEAKNNQPSIILLDDLDKFSEENNKNSEEYVVIQSLIDNIRNEDVYVVATVNCINKLPDSLVRSGRFDTKIDIKLPNEKELYEIFNYYLKKKKLSKNINIRNISSILWGGSCADLEKVCNQASIYAGYKNKDNVEMEDLLRASIELRYDTNIENINKEDEYIINIAYHEAGHALVGELLQPGSVSFITVVQTESNTKGLTMYHENEHYFDDIKFMENRVKTLLAGKAATEIVFNTCDTGSNSDIQRAYDIVERFVDNYCTYGFDSWFRTPDETSEKVKQTKDDNINKLITTYYNEVKEILIKNRILLDKLAKVLEKKKILFEDELVSIISHKK